jgi:uridine phosphorylase
MENYLKGILGKGLLRFMSRESQITYMVLSCRPKDIAPTILLPATDYVMGIIKKHFKKDNMKTHGKIVSGVYNDANISFTTSGIGAPAAAMTMEALRAAGVKSIVRVDYCGSLTDDIEIGDIIICSEAICGDGTTPHYLTPDSPYPRVPGDSGLLSKLKEGFESKKVKFQYGPVWSHDALFKEPPELLEKARSYGAIAIDMETSAIFALGQLYNISTAAILVVTDQPHGKEFLTEKIKLSPRILQNLDKSIDNALNNLSPIED